MISGLSLSGATSTYGIGIDLEDILVECRVDPNDISHLVIDLQLERAHGSIKVDTVEILKEQHLGISLSSITRFRSFGRFANLDDDNVAAQVSARPYAKQGFVIVPAMDTLRDALTAQHGPRAHKVPNTPLRNSTAYCLRRYS